MTRMATCLPFAMAITLGFATTGCDQLLGDPEPEPAKLPLGSPAPEVKVALGTGPFVLSEAIRQKPVLLEFMATWCPSCKAAVEEVNSLQQELPEVTFLVLNVDGEEGPSIEEFTRTTGASHPIVWQDPPLAAGAYEVEAVPTFFLIGHDQKIAWSLVGDLTDRAKEGLRVALAALPAPAPAADPQPEPKTEPEEDSEAEEEAATPRGKKKKKKKSKRRR